MAMGPRTDRVAESLAGVAAALDGYLAGRGPDPVVARAEWTAALHRPLPEQGVGADAVLEELVDVLVAHPQRTSDPGFWGWIVTGPPTVPVVAQTAAAIASPHRQTITPFNLVEDLSLRWLADLCGLPAHMEGLYSSGGSTANLLALGAARQHAFEQRGRDVAAEGYDGTPVAVYASEQVHHTIQRSAGVLGLGRRSVRLVPTDDGLRMRPDALRALLEADAAAGVVPIAVVGTAGTTNTGAIDPLREVGTIAHDHGAWFHVDGAYGLPGILDDRVTHLYDGLELADSAVVDPHKWLGAPVGTGATFVRDRSLLYRAFTQEPADYLTLATDSADEAQMSLDAMGIPYSELGLELTAPARGVAVWSILREIGREGMAARIRTDDDHARQVADEARAHPRLELLTEPTLSIVCFRYRGDVPEEGLDALNAELLHRLHLETPYLPSSTRIRGAYALRPCWVSTRTTQELVDGFTAAVVASGDELAARV